MSLCVGHSTKSHGAHTDRPTDTQFRIRVEESENVDPGQFSSFMQEMSGPIAARFFAQHANWWYRGVGHRFVALCDGEVAGYRGVVPTVIALGGAPVPAVWAMQLYVAPRFRGRGIQRLLDQRVLEAASLRMSFPNELGAKIYVKHGYALRDDVHLLRLPLIPRSIRFPKSAGTRGKLLRAGALALTPLTEMYRSHLRRYRSNRTEVTSSPDIAAMESLFFEHLRPDVATTWRDADFLRWRYADSPYRTDLAFYWTRADARLSHYAVVRFFPYGGSVAGRILDLFGDEEDHAGVGDLLATIVSDAVGREAIFVEILASSPVVARTARRAGFVVSRLRRFRWRADDPAIHQALFSRRLYWTAGDGEHDLPNA